LDLAKNIENQLQLDIQQVRYTTPTIRSRQLLAMAGAPAKVERHCFHGLLEAAVIFAPADFDLHDTLQQPLLGGATVGLQGWCKDGFTEYDTAPDTLTLVTLAAGKDLLTRVWLAHDGNAGYSVVAIDSAPSHWGRSTCDALRHDRTRRQSKFSTKRVHHEK